MRGEFGVDQAEIRELKGFLGNAHYYKCISAQNSNFVPCA